VDPALGSVERLIEIAQSDTVQAEIVADFLLALWNADNCGGFNLANVWGLDRAIVEDMQRVVGLIATVGSCPDQPVYGSDFKRIVILWRLRPPRKGSPIIRASPRPGRGRALLRQAPAVPSSTEPPPSTPPHAGDDPRRRPPLSGPYGAARAGPHWSVAGFAVGILNRPERPVFARSHVEIVAIAGCAVPMLDRVGIRIQTGHAISAQDGSTLRPPGSPMPRQRLSPLAQSGRVSKTEIGGPAFALSDGFIIWMTRRQRLVARHRPDCVGHRAIPPPELQSRKIRSLAVGVNSNGCNKVTLQNSIVSFFKICILRY
jgi:hypothetical protein